MPGRAGEIPDPPFFYSWPCGPAPCTSVCASGCTSACTSLQHGTVHSCHRYYFELITAVTCPAGACPFPAAHVARPEVSNIPAINPHSAAEYSQPEPTSSTQMPLAPATPTELAARMPATRKRPRSPDPAELAQARRAAFAPPAPPAPPAPMQQHTYPLDLGWHAFTHVEPPVENQMTFSSGYIGELYTRPPGAPPRPAIARRNAIVAPQSTLLHTSSAALSTLRTTWGPTSGEQPNYELPPRHDDTPEFVPVSRRHAISEGSGENSMAYQLDHGKRPRAR